MTSPLLELGHVTKRFGRVVIAEDLSEEAESSRGMFQILERHIDIWTPHPRIGTCSPWVGTSICRNGIHLTNPPVIRDGY